MDGYPVDVSVGLEHQVISSHAPQVEVRSRFDGRWCRGFHLVEVDVREDGTEWVRVRRDSDGLVLPSWFAADDVVVQRRFP